jgi:hypothetical protein
MAGYGLGIEYEYVKSGVDGKRIYPFTDAPYRDLLLSLKWKCLLLNCRQIFLDSEKYVTNLDFIRKASSPMFHACVTFFTV